MTQSSSKLNFLALLKLRCPYCGETPLQREGSRFQFRDGCERCNYSYEREVGYFTGASWMIAFPAVALVGMSLGALLLWKMPEMDALQIAIGICVVMLMFAIWFMPYSMALWLYCDHYLHPLDQDDRFRRREV